MEIYKLRHDVNGLIFKLETSLQLIREEFQGSNQILEICESSLNSLKLLLDILFTVEKIKAGEYPLNLEEIKKGDIPDENIEIQTEKIKADRKLLKLVLDILKEVPSGELAIKNGSAVLKCKKPFSNIEKFYIDSIILILKLFEIDTKVHSCG